MTSSTHPKAMTSLPEPRPIDWTNPLFKNLRALLVDAYRDEADARNFLDGVKMVEGTIPVCSRSMQNFWHEVMNQAHSQTKLMAIIEAAIADPKVSLYHHSLQVCQYDYQDFLSAGPEAGGVPPAHPAPLLPARAEDYETICGIEFVALPTQVQTQLLGFAATRKAYEQQHSAAD